MFGLGVVVTPPSKKILRMKEERYQLVGTYGLRPVMDAHDASIGPIFTK